MTIRVSEDYSWKQMMYEATTPDIPFSMEDYKNGMIGMSYFMRD